MWKEVSLGCMLRVTGNTKGWGLFEHLVEEDFEILYRKCTRLKWLLTATCTAKCAFALDIVACVHKWWHYQHALFTVISCYFSFFLFSGPVYFECRKNACYREILGTWFCAQCCVLYNLLIELFQPKFICSKNDHFTFNNFTASVPFLLCTIPINVWLIVLLSWHG